MDFDMMIALFQNTSNSVLVLLLFPLAYYMTWMVYSLYFHPLSRIPGPKLWIISRIPYTQSLRKGEFANTVRSLHNRYGPVVRLANDEVSFIDSQAWTDIYGLHHGNKFPKNPIWLRQAINGAHSIISAPEGDHARFRRILSNAFTDKTLKEQAPIIHAYVDLLVSRLRKSAESSTGVDLKDYFTYTAFDITGQLSFGESFHCLESGHYHPWVDIFQKNFKALTFDNATRFYPGLQVFLSYLIPRSMWEKRSKHFGFIRDRVGNRLSEPLDAEKKDFMSYIRRWNDEKGMSVPEIESTFSVIILAGSESVGTAMTSVIYHLLKSQENMQRLCKEIRETFETEEQITMEALGAMSFLNAVISEGMRLGPPTPAILGRLSPGAHVCGYWLPSGTQVSIPMYSAYRSPLNFSSPDSFMPQRWLHSAHDNPEVPIHNTKAFNPFSVGSRNCIGKKLGTFEVQLILAKLLWHYEVTWEGPDWDWEDQKTFMIWEKRPLEVKLAKVQR